ncbi:MAG: NAD-dependent malic enzyme [Chloroflexi bacterium]|nr:NAD-dependent malic enzyme [Ktedonobacteraceae bacterium]MBV9707742.1 NAD-dependent malic enzyme [Chloroflexota bacterium]
MRNYRMLPSVSAERWRLETWVTGSALLGDPMLNRSTAFTPEEREKLDLVGLLPSPVTTIDEQVKRSYAQYQQQPDDLSKNIFLTALQDRNEVLFYRLLSEHIAEMLPVVYDPTVALAIEQYSHEYRRPRGVYLSINHPEDIEASFRSFGAGPDEIDLIVATDAEEILGIGDWGVGGIDISVGKLAVYTAAAGIDPARVIPVMLDVGTNRESLLNDPFYLGNRHSRVRGERYDAFIAAYVQTAANLFPNVLLHWEDFGPSNGRRILEKYRQQVCTFNDDMQGTGAITLAGILSALRVSGQKLGDQRVVIFGSGTAGIGNADQIRAAMMAEGISKEEATRHFWCIDIQGLLTDDMGSALRDFQVPYARPASEVSGWTHDMPGGGISLAEVVARVHPTMLIGTSTAPGTFTEAIVKDMAAHTERPIIFPLSNPTSLMEASAAELLTWTDGKALVATGIPSRPFTYKGITYAIGQANNALLYPGLGLGTIVSRARHISDGMFMAAAKAVASLVDVHHPGASLLPHVENLREVSATVAVQVAKTAVTEGLARVKLADVVQQVQDAMWQPVYPQIQVRQEAQG